MYRLRGNTFITLLLRAGKQELSEKPEWGENSNGITRPNMFADLLRMAQPGYNPPKMKTLSSYFSQYLRGDLPFSPMYFAFNTPTFQHGLSDRIQDEYPAVLAEMDAFYKKYLLTTSFDRKLLVGGLVDAILGDDTFDGNFDIGGKQVSKTDLGSQYSFILQPFLVSVWNNILQNHPDASEGRDTYKEWSNDAGYNKPRQIVTDIGTERAKKITVSTELPKLETTEDTADGTPDNIKNEEPEPVIVEAAPQQKDFTDQTLYNNGRIYNQHAEKIVNIEHVDVLNI